jgi:zinc/manganese transport system permease protein
VSAALAAVFAPGFFDSSQVQIAASVGAIVAVVAGTVGVFTVIRGQAFAGEALGDIGTTGGSAAFLVAVGPLWGFAAVAVAAAAAMELIGIQRPRGRDVATGVVLGAALGLAALLLYLVAIDRNTTGATFTIVFGSPFAITSSSIPLVLVLGVIALSLIVVLFRPLLLCSISPELAAGRGIPVRLVGAAYLLALAIAVALAAFTIGTILSTALLIGPAAAALRLTRSPGRAIATAVLIGVGSILLGILMAYDSYDWPPRQHGWPVSFFVVSLIFVAYLLAGLARRAGLLRRRRLASPATGAESAALGAEPSRG